MCTHWAFFIILLFSRYLLNQYLFPFPCFELFRQHSEMTTLTLLQPEWIQKKFVAHNLCAFISLIRWYKVCPLFVWHLEWLMYYEFCYNISSLDRLSVVLICADMVYETIDMVWRFNIFHIDIPVWLVTITRFSISVLWYLPYRVKEPFWGKSSCIT